MSFVDVSNAKIVFASCFKRESSWYEAAVIFSLVQVLLFIMCILPFGFIPIIFVLPYLIVIEKQVLISKEVKQKFGFRELLLSARRYGRSFCIFIVKLVSVPFVYPLLSLTFSSFILSDCKELDFKGVLILSNELAKGKRKQIFAFMMLLLAMLQAIITFVFLMLQLLSIFGDVSLRVKFLVMFAAVLLMLVLVIIPLWRKYVENLYLNQKTETVRGN